MSNQIPTILTGATVLLTAITGWFAIRSQVRKDRDAAAKAIEERVRKEIKVENRLKELEDEIQRRDNEQEGHK
jgi:hypothetical protein